MLENMVEIARYPSAIEAAAARNRLDDADISACLDGEAMATWFWYLGSAIGGVRLLVDARHADRASAILSTPSDPADFDTVDFQDESPDDDDASDELPPQLIHAFRAAVIGIYFLTPLLNIYSMFLIIRHKLFGPPLNWRIGVACAANMLVFTLVSAFVYAAIMPPPIPTQYYHRAPDGTFVEVEYGTRTRTVSIPLVPNEPINVSTDGNDE
jgi:hypothetical protein